MTLRSTPACSFRELVRVSKQLSSKPLSPRPRNPTEERSYRPSRHDLLFLWHPNADHLCVEISSKWESHTAAEGGPHGNGVLQTSERCSLAGLDECPQPVRVALVCVSHQKDRLPRHSHIQAKNICQSTQASCHCLFAQAQGDATAEAGNVPDARTHTVPSKVSSMLFTSNGVLESGVDAGVAAGFFVRSFQEGSHHFAETASGVGS